MRARKILRRMSAITVLSLTILTVSAAAAPSAGAQSVQYFQYNVWGNKGAFGSGNLQSINYLTANFDYYVGVGAAPMAVSVQELCQGTTNSQANTLAAHLSPFGYTGTFYTADLDLDRPDSCELFGNAIYGYGSSAPDPSKQFAGGFSAQQSYSPGAEQRGIACGVYPFFGTVHTACSTHLDSSSTSVAGINMTRPDSSQTTPESLIPDSRTTSLAISTFVTTGWCSDPRPSIRITTNPTGFIPSLYPFPVPRLVVNPGTPTALNLENH